MRNEEHRRREDESKYVEMCEIDSGSVSSEEASDGGVRERERRMEGRKGGGVAF